MKPYLLIGAIGFSLVFTFASHAAAETFSRNLKLGDSGADVLSLQKALNGDPDTRLTLSGPGSPGEETDYFGYLTKAAVERFQEKHSRDTLAPVGLGAPTGFVGPLTRKKLASLAAGGGAAPAPSRRPSADTPPASPSNPNLVNIDFYLEEVGKLERVQGVDEATIQEHARFIRDYAASTSTDFRAQFESELKRNLTAPQSGFRKLIDPLLGWLAEPAQAITGAPFGGPIVYVYPCSCPPEIFSLGVGPPSTAPVLNYAAGTQAFLSYNLPAARFLLGLYTPGVQSCWQFDILGCFPIPAAGQIQPMVGSSPL